MLSALLAACGGGSSAPAPLSVPMAHADTFAESANVATHLPVLVNDQASVTARLVHANVSVPVHGSAIIAGDAIVYTPMVGYLGADTFTYTVRESGGGSGTASAVVTLSISTKLTLSGSVPEALPGTQVTLAIGAKATTGQTDASGNFSLPVSFDSGKGMITVTAQ